MPTLLQINTTAGTGSTGRIAEALGRLAISRGWESHIAYGRGRPVSASHLFELGSRWDYVRNSALAHVFDCDGFIARRATRALLAEMERLRPDIVHLHNLHGKYLNLPLLFAYLSERDIPVVWTLHDCWPMTGHCCHFDYVRCSRWVSGCHDCPQTAEYPECWFLDRSRRNYREKRRLFALPRRLTVVPVSEWLANIAQQSILSSRPRHLIYNGVDTDIFRPRPNGEEVRRRLGIRTPRMVVAVANVWKERKGTKDYIALSHRLPSDCTLVLVGLTTRQAAAMPPTVKVLPRTESVNELAEIYASADAVLNLSYEESFGLTTVEGLACGTPGVVYDATASPELVSADTGIVVRPGDIDGVVRAIDTVTRDPHFTAEACRHRALSLFDAGDRMADYFALYRRLTAED